MSTPDENLPSLRWEDDDVRTYLGKIMIQKWSKMPLDRKTRRTEFLRKSKFIKSCSAKNLRQNTFADHK